MDPKWNGVIPDLVCGVLVDVQRAIITGKLDVDSHNSLFTSLSPHAPDVPRGLDPKEAHRVALGWRSVVLIIGKGIESSGSQLLVGLAVSRSPQSSEEAACG